MKLKTKYKNVYKNYLIYKYKCKKCIHLSLFQALELMYIMSEIELFTSFDNLVKINTIYDWAAQY